MPKSFKSLFDLNELKLIRSGGNRFATRYHNGYTNEKGVYEATVDKITTDFYQIENGIITSIKDFDIIHYTPIIGSSVYNGVLYTVIMKNN